MILALILAAAQPQTAIEAERAFAKLAQARGQWTAFRATAAPDGAAPEALMFVPRPVEARTWLKDRADPARAVEWWPIAAWVSCNGYMAITTGGTLSPDGTHGYFTRVWTIDDPDRPEWRWIVDHAAALSTPRPRTDEPVVRRASCARVESGPAQPELAVSATARSGGGASEKDLRYDYSAASTGARELRVSFWNGKTFEVVLHDVVPPSE